MEKCRDLLSAGQRVENFSVMCLLLVLLGNGGAFIKGRKESTFFRLNDVGTGGFS